MPVQRPMILVEENGILYVQVRWFGLNPSEDTLEKLERVYEDAPQLVEKLLVRKSTPKTLASKAKSLLKLPQKKGM